jgi:hypothetical protein
MTQFISSSKNLRPSAFQFHIYYTLKWIMTATYPIFSTILYDTNSSFHGMLSNLCSCYSLFKEQFK